MKNYIIIMIVSLMLFVSCSDVELDSFAIDGVHVNLNMSWGDGCPRYEVRVNNPNEQEIDKVRLRLRYHDKAVTEYGDDEQKEVEMTSEDDRYVYDLKVFPSAFAGNMITAYAYVSVDGLNLGSNKCVMTVPESSDIEVTSAKFVYDDPSLNSTNRGTLYIYGQFSPWHLYYARGSKIALSSDMSMYGCYPDRLVIRDCYPEIYGTANIILLQSKNDLAIDVDIPGELSIDKMDRTSVRVGGYLTLKVSGLRKDCTYEVEGMDVENIGRGTITCKPYIKGKQKVCLIEKHENFKMSVYSKDEVDIY